jgi:hypothetical protein
LSPFKRISKYENKDKRNVPIVGFWRDSFITGSVAALFEKRVCWSTYWNKRQLQSRTASGNGKFNTAFDGKNPVMRDRRIYQH